MDDSSRRSSLKKTVPRSTFICGGTPGEGERRELFLVVCLAFVPLFPHRSSALPTDPQKSTKKETTSQQTLLFFMAYCCRGDMFSSVLLSRISLRNPEREQYVFSGFASSFIAFSFFFSTSCAASSDSFSSLDDGQSVRAEYQTVGHPLQDLALAEVVVKTLLGGARYAGARVHVLLLVPPVPSPR